MPALAVLADVDHRGSPCALIPNRTAPVGGYVFVDVGGTVVKIPFYNL